METNPLEQHFIKPDLDEGRPLHRRKPLLYPSELRGHGSATLVHPFDLRETALALSKRPRFGLASVLATVWAPLALAIA